MIWRSLLLGLLCIVALACDESSSTFVFDARIIDGQNGNPAEGTDATILRIGIQEGDLPSEVYEYPIDDGDFDGLLEFRLFTAPTRIRVQIEGATTDLLTAPPLFVPTATEGILRVVAASASSCERVTFDLLASPRAFFGMVQSGTFALVVGGTSASDDQIEFFDALEWESRLFPDDFSVSDLGETRAASIDETQILVLPTNAGPFIFDMLDSSSRITPVVLHNGAGPSSGLVSVPGIGAMVIGGDVSGEAQSGVSLVEPDGRVTSMELSEARSGPSATALGTDVLVAGGDADGTAEVLRDGDSTGTPIEGVMDGVRESGLLVGDGESRALWIGGTDASDVVRNDTVRFDDCPGACVAAAGPQWTSARLAALQPPQSALIIGGESSTQVDQVLWNESDVEIQELLQLDVPRAGAGGIVLESGAFIVAGGDDGVSIREDFEFCVPATLEPL